MAVSFTYYLPLWTPHTATYAPDSLPASGSWAQIGDYVYERQGGTAIETGGTIAHLFHVTALIPAGAILQVHLWDATNSLEITSGSYSRASANAAGVNIVQCTTFANLPAGDAEIIANYKLSTGTGTHYNMGWGVSNRP